jgi:hypothetical protein
MIHEKEMAIFMIFTILTIFMIFTLFMPPAGRLLAAV